MTNTEVAHVHNRVDDGEDKCDFTHEFVKINIVVEWKYDGEAKLS